MLVFLTTSVSSKLSSPQDEGPDHCAEWVELESMAMLTILYKRTLKCKPFYHSSLLESLLKLKGLMWHQVQHTFDMTPNCEVEAWTNNFAHIEVWFYSIQELLPLCVNSPYTYLINIAQKTSLLGYRNSHSLHSTHEDGYLAQSELFFRLLIKNIMLWVHISAYPIFEDAPHGAQPTLKPKLAEIDLGYCNGYHHCTPQVNAPVDNAWNPINSLCQNSSGVNCMVTDFKNLHPPQCPSIIFTCTSGEVTCSMICAF